MKSPIAQTAHAPTRTRRLDGIARNLLHKQLAQLREGELVLVDGETQRFGSVQAGFPLSVTIQINEPGFYSDVVFGGSVGAGEAYMAGLWTCSDLTALVRILLRNRHVLDGMDGGYALIASPLRKLIHAVNRNTQSGSRRNIAAHYDLGNDFFRLFLDDTLMYSAAVFATPETGLREASIAKLDLICRKLQLKPTDHLVEIGTGWGGFAIHAAANYGCKITTTTISQNQFDLAQERIAKAGQAGRVTVLLEDYRELKGQYDKLVSIEMIEAVGHHYYAKFFRQCAALLKPDGAMLIQAITIADQQFANARDEVDFIKRYIFPGSCIPAITPLLQAATRSSDLKLIHLEDIGPHYATTLNHWRQNFFSHIDEVRKLGYPDSFIRMWEFYLTYCEAGFIERVLGDVQLLFMKPLRRGL
ncbi:MAG: cyclopropane-fatty-acyl-phospholipid synthase family protein [Candidatus Methylumidiphilus sp.]